MWVWWWWFGGGARSSVLESPAIIVGNISLPFFYQVNGEATAYYFIIFYFRSIYLRLIHFAHIESPTLDLLVATQVLKTRLHTLSQSSRNQF